MRARVAAPLGLGLLVVVSAVLRTRQMDAGLWIDEGLSIGIAERPLADIPGALRQDGSPPLYYLLLHGWMGIVGSSEAATRALSLLFALLAVPVAWWAGRLLFGERAGWIEAVLVALNPFITEYAQETRMYTLVGLLGLVATTCWLRALRASSAAALGFGASLAAMLYTHNWALFFGAATAVAWLVLLLGAHGQERGRLLRTGAIAYGFAAVLYLPWLPSLLYQAAHTGAPWSNPPSLDALLGVPARVLGDVVWLVLVLAGSAGAIALRRRGRTVLALALLVTLTVLLAWLASQVTPAWAPRYLAAVAAPALLLCAAALSSAGRVGLAGVAVAAIAWAATDAPAEKSNVRAVIAAIAPELRAGDVVVSTRPSEVPVLRYYLPDGLRYATLTGPVRAPGLADQRDIVRRLAHTSPARDLRPLIDELPAGRRLVLVEPIVHEPWRWDAPSTSLVRMRSEQWWRALSEDRRLRVIHFAPLASWPRKPNPVRATVYVKDPFSIPHSRRES